VAAKQPRDGPSQSKLRTGSTDNCTQRDKDKYGRPVAVCYLGGIDLNKWLVLNGLALAYREYSLDYIDAENEARTTKAGIWQGTFENPWNWRKGERGITGNKSSQIADIPKNKPSPIERTCGQKRTCGEMTSCDEAQFYLI
jgi:hypothetical protein